MKIVECRGTDRRIGEMMGEALRVEIREHIDLFVKERETLAERIRYFADSTARYMPGVMEQFKGISRSAGVTEEELLALNLPPAKTVLNLEECSNILFKSGPSGPLWGKNNDGGSPPGKKRRPVCVLRIYPSKGIPAICFTFCGWLSGGDMMNAEGVAAGHSSVGSRFVQNYRHASVLHWLYEGMLKVRSARELGEHITSVPVFGKGFSQVAIDRSGFMFSAEIACPLVQIRMPEYGATGMNCVNCFQLPLLKYATNRSPAQLKNAEGRKKCINTAVEKDNHSIENMKEILRHHGQYSVCRHGGKDEAHTEYSMIGIPAEKKALFAEGYPCETDYVEITL